MLKLTRDKNPPVYNVYVSARRLRFVKIICLKSRSSLALHNEINIFRVFFLFIPLFLSRRKNMQFQKYNQILWSIKKGVNVLNLKGKPHKI